MQTNTKQLSIMSVLKQSSVIKKIKKKLLTLFFYQLPSLYKGIKAPLTGLAGINAIVFGVHGTMMRFAPLPANGVKHSKTETYTWCALAGAVSGFVQSVITGPMELVKTRSQLTQRPVTACFRQIMSQEGGLRGLFRGLGITFARDTPALATYFLSYEMLMDYLRERRQTPSRSSLEFISPPPEIPLYPSTLAVLFAGGMAGMFSWLVVYPLDVIKSRLQADVRYSSSAQVVLETYKKEGLSVFMRGCSPTLLRAFPTNAATFAVVSWTLYSYETYYRQPERSPLPANGEILD